MAQRVTNAAQTANKTNAAQTAAKSGQTTTTSPYGGMNYDTYLKSQGKDTADTGLKPKASTADILANFASGYEYAPDGTPINKSTGGTTTGTTNTAVATGATGATGTTGGGAGNILAKYIPSSNPSFLTNTGTTETGDGFPVAPVTPSSPSGSYRASSGGGGSAGYTAAVLPSATSQADYINAMYDANEQKRKAALEAAYDANVATLDRQAATIAPQYQQAANAAAAQSAVAQAAFNERAAAAGMNTGAGSQAALAQNNALVSGVSAIRQAESEALAEVEAKRADLATQYQKAIADAVANNEADRALALYNEAVRVDESMVSTAANQATENYRAWQAKYK